MLNKKRIFNIEGYLSRYCTDIDFYVGVRAANVPEQILSRLGLKAEPGVRKVPYGIGPISKFNAKGKVMKLKNQPKIEVRQRRHSRKTGEYLGTWHLWMWQRQLVEAPKVPVEFVEKDGELLIISPILQYIPENEEINCHTVNIFLECFGHAAFYTKDLQVMVWEPKTTQGNWVMLPEGTSIEEKQEKIEQVVRDRESRGIPTYKSGLEMLKAYGPGDIVAGTNGFNGYCAYVYPERGIILLECLDYGNATYVLPYEGWEKTSQLTKGEILEGNLCLNRIPHDVNWASRINRVMRG